MIENIKRKLHHNISISALSTIYIGTSFVLAGLMIIFLVNSNMRRQAIIEAKEKSRLILDHNLATHHYFTHSLKPAVFKIIDGTVDDDYFDPVWMSSTYVIHQIEKVLGEMNSGSSYYYKECAVNARSPINEADESERKFVEELNSNADIQIRSGIRMIDNSPYFEVLHRGESMEQSCLKCHSTPENAPAGMVDIFGSDRSFGRNLGEVVSAISIRIPLTEAYANANRFSIRLSALLLMILGVLYLVQRRFYNRYMHSAIVKIRDKALQISTDDKHLGEKIDLPAGRELYELTQSFNRMSGDLLGVKVHLEERVKERTAELQESLEKVKTLSGLLPICASCKKIRDDQGYWKEVEVFVKHHSEAEFTHGICPECSERLYGDFLRNTDDNK